MILYKGSFIRISGYMEFVKYNACHLVVMIDW